MASKHRRMLGWCFNIPTAYECKNSLNKFDYIRVECSHHLWVSPLVNLHSQNDKVAYVGPTTFQILGVKVKSNHQGDFVRTTNNLFVTKREAKKMQITIRLHVYIQQCLFNELYSVSRWEISISFLWRLWNESGWIPKARVDTWYTT